MPIQEIIKTAFCVQNQIELRALCQQKKAEAEAYFNKTAPDFKMPRDSSLDHSVLQIEGKYYLIAGKGLYLGEGTFGRVKLAICIDDLDKLDELYAVKREITNTPSQAIEEKITKEVGIMVADKVSRTSKTPKTTPEKRPITQKYYSVLRYLGRDLFKLIATKALTPDQKLDVAIDTALALQKLHYRKPAWAHRDIKPENVVVDCEHVPLRVSLIDFGLSEQNVEYTSAVIKKGSRAYMPALGGALYAARMRELGDLNAADVFALKITITGRRRELALVNLDDLPLNQNCLWQVLNTQDEALACMRKDSAGKIAAHLICYKLQISSCLEFTEAQSQEIIELYQQNQSGIPNTKAIQDKVSSFVTPLFQEAFNVCLNFQGSPLLIRDTIFTQELAEQIIHLRDQSLSRGAEFFEERVRLLLYFNALTPDITSFSQFTDEEIESLSRGRNNPFSDVYLYDSILVLREARTFGVDFRLESLSIFNLKPKLLDILRSEKPNDLIRQELAALALALRVPPAAEYDWTPLVNSSDDSWVPMNTFDSVEVQPPENNAPPIPGNGVFQAPVVYPSGEEKEIMPEVLLNSLRDLNDANERQLFLSTCIFKLNAYLFSHSVPRNLTQMDESQCGYFERPLCRQLLEVLREEKDVAVLEAHLLSFLDKVSEHPIHEHSLALDILRSLFPDDVSGKLNASHFSACLKLLHQRWMEPPMGASALTA